MTSDLIRLSEPNASATVHGLSGWIVMDDPPPEGLDRLIVAAGPETPTARSTYGDWKIAVDEHHTTLRMHSRSTRSGFDLHPGCIVGAVTVAEAVPIVEKSIDAPASATGCISFLRATGCVVHDDLYYDSWNEMGVEDAFTRISDQLPWGDWSPGRWAWRIENPLPTTVECPVCEGAGRVDGPHGFNLVRCPTCDRTRSCPPLPYDAPEGLSVFDPGRLG